MFIISLETKVRLRSACGEGNHEFTIFKGLKLHLERSECVHVCEGETREIPSVSAAEGLLVLLTFSRQCCTSSQYAIIYNMVATADIFSTRLYM